MKKTNKMRRRGRRTLKKNKPLILKYKEEQVGQLPDRPAEKSSF
jgi:hypothetical protein